MDKPVGDINTNISDFLLKDDYDCFLLVDDSISNPNLYYATGFLAADTFAYLQTSDKEVMLVSRMELSRARKESSIENVLPIKDKTTSDLKKVIEENNISKIAVNQKFPLYIADELRSKGFSVSPVDDPFTIMRRRKTPEEVEYIKKAQHACEASMRVAFDLLSNCKMDGDALMDGKTALSSEFLRAQMGCKMMELGCIPYDMIVAGGEQAADPHARGEGPLQADAPIVIDITCFLIKERYFSDMSRTFVVGTPSDSVREMYDAVLEAQNAALDMIGGGVPCRDIHYKVCDILEEHGYDTTRSNSATNTGFIHSTGHGVGLEVHEAPGVRDNDEVLEPGNVITVEPGLYDKNVGGVRLEDIVAVTKDGCENLTKFEKKLVI